MQRPQGKPMSSSTRPSSPRRAAALIGALGMRGSRIDITARYVMRKTARTPIHFLRRCFRSILVCIFIFTAGLLLHSLSIICCCSFFATAGCLTLLSLIILPEILSIRLGFVSLPLHREISILYSPVTFGKRLMSLHCGCTTCEGFQWPASGRYCQAYGSQLVTSCASQPVLPSSTVQGLGYPLTWSDAGATHVDPLRSAGLQSTEVST